MNGEPTTRSTREPTDPMRLRLALKVAIAATVSALICIALHLQTGYMAPLIASLALILFPGRVAEVGFAAFIGSFLAGGVACLIIVATVSAPLILFAGVVAWLFLWMAFVVPFPLAHLMGGILIGMLLLTVAVQSAADVGTVLVDYLQQEFVGLLVASVLDKALWPITTEQQFRRTLATLFVNFARSAEALRVGATPEQQHDRPATDILNRIVRLSGLAARLPASRGLEQQRLVVRCRVAWDRLALFAEALSASTRHDAQRAALAETVLCGFADHWRRLNAAALAAEPAPPLDARSKDAARTLGALIPSPSPASSDAPHEDGDELAEETFARLVELSVANHGHISALYNRCLAAERRQQGAGAAPRAERPRLTWPQAQAWRQSARIVLIIVLLTFGLVYLQLPGSTLVAFYGISFGLAANVGQLYFRSGTGFLGALIGLLYGVIGIIVVLQTPTLPVLMAMFFLGVLMFAYVAYGDEIFAFAGLQATLIVPYVLVVFEGPQWTLDNGITRAVALVVAASAAAVVHYVFWPVRVFAQLRAGIADTLQRYGEAVAVPLTGGGDPRAGFLGEADRLAAAVSSGEALLKDAQYAAGSGDPRSRAYLTITRQLEDILASFLFLQRVADRYRHHPAVAAYLAANGPLLDAVRAAFLSLAAGFRDATGSMAIALLQPPAPPDAPQGGDVGDAGESRRQVALIRQTLENIVGAINTIIGVTTASPSANLRSS